MGVVTCHRCGDAITLSWSMICEGASNKYLLRALLAANVIGRAPWAERGDAPHAVVWCAFVRWLSAVRLALCILHHSSSMVRASSVRASRVLVTRPLLR